MDPEEQVPQEQEPAMVPADPFTVIQQMQQLVLQHQQQTQAAIAAQQQQTQVLAQQLQQFIASQQAQQPVVQQQPQPAPTAAATSSRMGSFKPPKPETYSGKQPTTLPSWFISMQSYLEATGVALDTPEAVRGAASYLSGKALEWYHLQFTRSGNTVPYATYADFKQALQDYLLPVDPAYAARDKLDRFRQLTSAQDYVTGYNALMLNIPDMSEADRVHNFVRGLKQQVQTQVLMQQPTTLSQAQQLAIKADAAVYKSKPSGFGYRSTLPSSSTPNGVTPMELGAHEATKEAELSAGECYACGKKGHFSWECPTSSGGRGRGRGRGKGRGRGGRGRGRGSSTHHVPPN